MNISKTSWHYRLLNKLDMITQWETLCKYFWKVVFASIAVPLVVLGGTWILTLPFWWMFVPEIPTPLVIFIGSVEIVFLIIALIGLINKRFDEEIEAGTRPRPLYKEPKPPNLFKQWLKAKHDTVCPVIDFVDESNG